MDDKRLEFVAMILAGEEIKYLAPDAIRKRVREANAAYDIMVEELGGGKKPRYPWSKAPQWANWAATDEDGEQWWFEDRPKAGVISWRPNGGGACLAFGFSAGADITGWDETLEARPNE